MPEVWKYAESTRGDSFVLREIGKTGMSKHAIAKLEEAMRRVEEGASRKGEIGKVRGSILELRVNQDKCWYRLLFARCEGGYVALLLGAKKTNTLDRNWIDTAESRLRDYSG